MIDVYLTEQNVANSTGEGELIHESSVTSEITSLLCYCTIYISSYNNITFDFFFLHFLVWVLWIVRCCCCWCCFWFAFIGTYSVWFGLVRFSLKKKKMSNPFNGVAEWNELHSLKNFHWIAHGCYCCYLIRS